MLIINTATNEKRMLNPNSRKPMYVSQGYIWPSASRSQKRTCCCNGVCVVNPCPIMGDCEGRELTKFRCFLEYSSSPCGLSVDAARFPLAILDFLMYSSAWMAGTRLVGGQFATVMSKSMSDGEFGWCPLTWLDCLGDLALPLCLECDLCGIVMV